jgi:hypothetical protein
MASYLPPYFIEFMLFFKHYRFQPPDEPRIGPGRGKYSLAVPLLGQLIQRQTSSDTLLKTIDQ